MIKTCPLCSSTLKPQWPDKSFYLCPECGFILRNQAVDQQSLASLYENSWQDPYNKVDETGGTSSRFAKLYTDRLLKSLKRDSFHGCKIMDFGAGRGDMAVELQARGAQVTAVEPFGYEFLRQRGIPAFRTLSEVESPESFDGIVILNVIEHLVSPWEELASLRRFLRPDGWIFLATPNRGGINAMVRGAGWREARRKGHIILFHAPSLGKLLRRCGYHRIRWLRWFFPYSPRPAQMAKDWLLQTARLDGELKFLAYKEDRRG